jgi:hypothetical protein
MDGGALLGGTTSEYDDTLVMKLDPNWNIAWPVSLGGDWADERFSSSAYSTRGQYKITDNSGIFEKSSQSRGGLKNG